jgi:hypothetical protein
MEFLVYPTCKWDVKGLGKVNSFVEIAETFSSIPYIYIHPGFQQNRSKAKIQKEY